VTIQASHALSILSDWENLGVRYKLTIDVKTYEVDIEPVESDAARPDLKPQLGSSRPTTGASPPLSSAPPPIGGAPADKTNVCRSPIAASCASQLRLGRHLRQTMASKQENGDHRHITDCGQGFSRLMRP
jgi:hypothetical protein